MLTLNECKEILNEEENNYTDEQIILIRDWLYHMADIAIDSLEQKENKQINNRNGKQKPYEK